MAQISITTPHPLATAAGLEVLRAGGTAIEAVIAAGAVLAVVTPHFCGLGGDAVWMVCDAQGKADALLAIGQGISAPQPQRAIPTRGTASIMTTAALVDGWQTALDYSAVFWQGKARLSPLLQPAIALAQDGYQIGKSQEYWGNFRAADCGDWPGFAAIFCDGTAPLQAGHWLRQPQLARSLTRIADRGAREFYEGALAADILQGLHALGVPITSDDLCRTKTRILPALSQTYRDYTLLAPPPPTQGLSTLQIMAVLNTFDLSALRASEGEHLHLLVESVKQAFLSRHLIADPPHMAHSPDQMLDRDTITAMAARISLTRALPWPHRYQSGDTAFLAASDCKGRVASVLQSTYYDWGSGVVAGDTGILWQNRGAAFGWDANHQNGFSVGKLPFYTLNPGIALQAGRPALAYGTQGADGQPQTLAVLLTQLIDFSASPAQALAAPRILLGRTFSDDRDSLKIEGHLPPVSVDQLIVRGHVTSALPAFSPIFGLAGVIRMGDSLTAAHDPRGEGTAVVEDFQRTIPSYLLKKVHT